ncbi:chorismate mutase [Granulicella sp. S190]|uniref:chorismate mutase n=1 Tax=Granulicella sp. S190 TaxID=1747226 RepID=UPI00131B664F|nr:chorismate mutase [Granulicella sp. S190]
MHTRYVKQAIAGAILMASINTAYTQTAVDSLQPLVELSARRLTVAQQVALSKWDSGTPVQDSPREAKVIADAVRDGAAKGLDQTFLSNFFKDQIEANKTVQYSLLATWHRAGDAPTHSRIDLVATIRPELDQIQTSLLKELADTEKTRSSPSCKTDLANAVGRYLSAHKIAPVSLQAITLDRSVAEVCKP